MKFIENAPLHIEALEFCKNNIGKEITIKGTVHRVRDMGDVSFIILRTDKHLIQCTALKENIDVSDIRDAMVVAITGKVRTEERASGSIEILINKFEILAKSYDTLPVPLGKKYMGLSLDTDLPLRPITLRHPIKRAVFSIQGAIATAFGEYMSLQGFTRVHTPKIVAAGAEGGANIFKLDYFGMDAYLAQSPQFYKQYMAGVFGRVFEIGGVYRAEKHSTSRHLNEYIGLDFEMSYINDMYEVMAMETAMLDYVIQYVDKNCKAELETLNLTMPAVGKIPSVTFAQAKEIMLEHFNHKSKNRYDLDPNEEQMLCEYATKEHNNEFIFVTHFPSSKRPFYAMDDKEDKSLALSFDLLFRGLEITTGGQRIHDYKEQCDKMSERDMNLDDFESFLMMHKYGMPPHGGLGIGLERLTMKLLNLANVREASLFPRDMNRLIP